MFSFSLRIQGKAGKPEQKHKPQCFLSQWDQLSCPCFNGQESLVAHNCPNLCEISLPQVSPKTTPTHSDQDFRPGKLFSHLQHTSLQRSEISRDGKGSDSHSLDALETCQGITEKQRNETDPRKTCSVLCLLGTDSRLAWPHYARRAACCVPLGKQRAACFKKAVSAETSASGPAVL